MFQATINVDITRKAGPHVTDPQHVANWIVADGAWLDGARNAFTFDVCPTHTDPDDCHEDCTAEPAVFRASVGGVDTIHPNH